MHNSIIHSYRVVKVKCNTWCELGVQGKCTQQTMQHQPGQHIISKEKGATLGVTRTQDTLLFGHSALPAELPGQLSRQDS